MCTHEYHTITCSGDTQKAEEVLRVYAVQTGTSFLSTLPGSCAQQYPEVSGSSLSCTSRLLLLLSPRVHLICHLAPFHSVPSGPSKPAVMSKKALVKTQEKQRGSEALGPWLNFPPIATGCASYITRLGRMYLPKEPWVSNPKSRKVFSEASTKRTTTTKTSLGDNHLRFTKPACMRTLKTF